MEPRAGTDRVCICLYDDEMSIQSRAFQSYTSSCPVFNCYPGISVCHQSASPCQTERQWWRDIDFPTTTASKCLTEFTGSLAQSVFPKLINHSLQVDIQIHSIMHDLFISMFRPSRSPSALRSSLNWDLPVLLLLCSSTVCSQIGRRQI